METRRLLVGAMVGLAAAACGSEQGGVPPGECMPFEVSRDGVCVLVPQVPATPPSCPALSLATGEVVFVDVEGASRSAKIWRDPSVEAKALIFYWHALQGSPGEIDEGLGALVIEQIVAEGGIVVAPFADPESEPIPWFLASQGSRPGNSADLRIADAIVACVLAQTSVDPERIHVLGMSAGGLQAAQMAYRRSGYVASAVTLSGGFFPVLGIPAMQEPRNKFALVAFHGGSGDVFTNPLLGTLSFEAASKNIYADLRAKGHFAMLCDHGLGHLPPMDDLGSTWIFFKAHPFGVAPWTDGGVAAGMPTYCTTDPQ